MRTNVRKFKLILTTLAVATLFLAMAPLAVSPVRADPPVGDERMQTSGKPPETRPPRSPQVPASESPLTVGASADPLTVDMPNGPETWETGTVHTIRWYGNGSVAAVKIEYSTDGGTSWSTVVASTENDGVYKWTVPNTNMPFTECRVKISDAATGTPSDVSDADFWIWASIITVDVNDPACVGTSGQPDPYAVVYCSIQDAIDDAVPGDTINVAAGTYNEKVFVRQEDVTLNGAQTGVDARGRTGLPESIISANDAYAVVIQRNRVTIDGFTITSSWAQNTDAAGIYVSDSIGQPGETDTWVERTVIKNNVVRDLTDGLRTGGPGIHGIVVGPQTQGTEVAYNEVRNLHMVGAGSGDAPNGILLWGNPGGEAKYINVHHNLVHTIENDNPAVHPQGIQAGAYSQYPVIHHNEVYGVVRGTGIALVNNPPLDPFRPAGPWNNATYNSVHDCGQRGIVVRLPSNLLGNTITGCPSGVWVDSDGVTIHFNNIYGNTDFGVETAGGVAVDAEDNWWGDASGPQHTAGAGTDCQSPGEGGWNCDLCNRNPDGLGDRVSNNVDYCPWLTELYVPPQPTCGDWVITANMANAETGESYATIYAVDTATDIGYGPFLGGQLGTADGALLDVAITPDGNTALVSSFGDQMVFFVDISDPTDPHVLDYVYIEGVAEYLDGDCNPKRDYRTMYAEDIAITPDGKYALVTDGAFSSLVPSINVETRTLVEMAYLDDPCLGVSRDAQAVTIAPNGTVIVASYFGGEVHTLTIDGSGHLTFAESHQFPEIEVCKTVDFDWPINVAVAPDGQTVLVVTAFYDWVSVFRITGPGTLTYVGRVWDIGLVWDPATECWNGGSQSVAFSGDGDQAYLLINGLATPGGSLLPSQLTILDITAPGEVSVHTAGAADLAYHGTGQFFGVDTVAVAGCKAYVGNPTSWELNHLVAVGFTDYISSSLQMPAPTGVGICPAPLPTTLTVEVVGAGTGFVTSDHTGCDSGKINCGEDCTEHYTPGTLVTLTAHPGMKSYLASWGGDCSGTGGTTTLTMDADKHCIATFGYPVGGIVVPVNKLGLVAPWLGLVGLASFATLAVALVRKRKT